MAVTDYYDVNPFYIGCTQTELSKLFGVPPQTTRDSLRMLPPCGKRGGRDVYSIAEAAKLLVRDGEEDAEKIRRILKLHHTDLPKMLSKEFWLAETHRQRYMLAAGDLWPTTKIVQWLGDAFKNVRLSLMLMADTVERSEPLTPGQRQAIIAMIDATLNDAADRLVNAFKDKRESEEGGSAPPEEDDGYEEL